MIAISQLITNLEKRYKDWRKEVVLLLDNAPWHTGKLIRKYLRLMQAPVILMSPYSPMLASVESLFG